MLRISLSPLLFVVVLLGVVAVTAVAAAPPAPPDEVNVTRASAYASAALHASAAPTPLSGVWYEYEWRFSTNGATPGGSTGTWSVWGAVTGDTVPASLLVKGQNWQARGRATDGVEASAWVECYPLYMEIMDAPPIPPTLATIEQKTYRTKDDLVVAVAWGSPAQRVDPDGDLISFRYQWRERAPGGSFNEIPLEIAGQPTGADTATLSRIATTKNHEYLCRVWGVSGIPGIESPASTASNIVTVVNTPPPAPGSVTVQPQSPFVGNDLTADVHVGVLPVTNEPLIDDDLDILYAERQWCVSTDGGFNFSEWTDGEYIAGSEVRRGQVWKARARFNDGEAVGFWRESMTVAVGNTPPVLQVVPVLVPDRPGSDEDVCVARNGRGAPLREVAKGVAGIDATDEDGDAITYKYEWARSNDGTTFGPWILGTVVLSKDMTSRGERWKARVAAFDGFVYGEWVETSNAARVKNGAPLPPTAVSFNVPAPLAGEAIIAEASGGSDPDGDPVTYGYSWQRSTDDGATFFPPDPAVNEAELPAGLTAAGEQWRVEAWTSDGSANSEIFLSGILTIGAAPPAPPTSCRLVPECPSSCEDLHAIVEGVEEGCTLQYRWLLSRDRGTTWRAFANTGPELDDSLTQRGEWWKVQVRVREDGAVSTWCTSNYVIILNSAPDVSAMTVALVPEDPGVNDQLQCVATGAVDCDGDQITYLCEWSYSNDAGGHWSDWGFPGCILTGVKLEDGQWWKCRVTATDGSDAAEPVESEPTDVAGAAPAAPIRVWITPEEPTNCDDLTANATNGMPDDEHLYYEFQWASTTDLGQNWSEWGNDGVQIGEHATEPGQWWKVRARACDGTLCSSWVQSNPVFIKSTPPQDPTVWIEPDSPGPDEELRACADSWDPDEDPVTFEFEWSLSTDLGVTWSGWNWTGETLSPSLTALNQMWRVRARSTDGVSYSEWVISEPVTIMGMLRSMTPANGSVNICRSSPVWVSFRWPVEEASAELRFRLIGPGGITVPGATAWVAGNETLRFTPHRPLAPNTLYTITLTGGIGLHDGGAIGWTESFSFTTGAGPVVLSHLPSSATARSGSCIVVVFDEPMSRKSVQDRFSISPRVSGSFSWIGKKMFFRPDDWLERGQTYTVCIGRNARSVSRRTLGKPYTWSFTVPPDEAPAVVSAAAAATSGGAQISVSLSAAANVQVEISNISGRVVATLPAQSLPQGVSTLLWNGRSATGTAAPWGRYLVRVEALSEGGTRTHAMTTLQK